MDTQLRPTEPPFELQRTQIPETLMELLAIVEPFDKRKDPVSLPEFWLVNKTPLLSCGLDEGNIWSP